jgi:archaellum component FlaC
MAEVVERLDSVERRLTSVEKGLSDLGAEVGGLREEVGGLRGEVGGLREEVGGLRGEVQKLRMLGEQNASNIKQIAEVQVHHGNALESHGRKFDEITKALEPLARIDAFVQLVAGEHEKRITDLERHTGIRE